MTANLKFNYFPVDSLWADSYLSPGSTVFGSESYSDTASSTISISYNTITQTATIYDSTS